MRHYDLLILGAGSGNMLPSPELAHLNTAIVEQDRFGGTCLNRGCIPSKMLVVTADAARNVETAARLGVHATLDSVDWPGIRDRIFGRIDPLHDSAVRYRRANGIDVYTEPARFVAPKVVEVGSERITADSIVVVTGARPVVPDIDGLSETPFHTSDTIMRVDEIPRSLVIIGGGFIAAEMAHVFGAFGSQVTIVQRAPRLLMAEDRQVSQRFTELAALRHRVLLDTVTRSVRQGPDGVTVDVAGAAGSGPVETIEATTLLVATGRRPNTDLLDATAGGLELDGDGRIVSDSAYRTSVPGVWTIGDATNHLQLKHLANAEGRVVRHNLLHPEDLWSLPTTLVPHAVFSDPQIASVGLTEEAARDGGVDHVVSVRNFSDAAYGWALEDTTSFVKILADPASRLLLGAHVIGPQAATLVQPLLQAMSLGQTIDQLAHGVFYIHPALTEVLEQALLDLALTQGHPMPESRAVDRRPQGLLQRRPGAAAALGGVWLAGDRCVARAGRSAVQPERNLDATPVVTPIATTDAAQKSRTETGARPSRGPSTAGRNRTTMTTADRAPSELTPAAESGGWYSKVPEITVVFWVLKVLTTGMGETAADFLTHSLVPEIAVAVAGLVLAGCLTLQLRADRYRAALYWSSVVMVSVFGTMAADAAHVGLGIPYAVSTSVFSLALVVILLTWRRVEGTLAIHSIRTRRRELFYWLTVMTTFALGTAVGDLTAVSLGLGFFLSGVLFTAVIAIPAAGYRWWGWGSVFSFWFAYIVTRPIGASFADWMAVPTDRGGLGWGTGLVTLIWTAAIVAVVIYLTVTRSDVEELGGDRRGD